MKKVLNFLMVLLMVMGLGMASGMTAFQAEAAETSGETALAANQDGDKGADAKKAVSGIYDEANLLSEDEEASLMAQLEKYSSKYSADIAIVTTNDAGGMSSQAYADAYAEKIGQSMSGDEYPGILFLIDMDNRQIYMATQGQAMNYYDDYRINKVLDNCYSHITDGDYKGTCEAFLKGVRADPSADRHGYRCSCNICHGIQARRSCDNQQSDLFRCFRFSFGRQRGSFHEPDSDKTSYRETEGRRRFRRQWRRRCSREQRRRYPWRRRPKLLKSSRNTRYNIDSKRKTWRNDDQSSTTFFLKPMV